MTEKEIKVPSIELANSTIEGLQEKKGFDIVRMDLRGVRNSVVDFFVICHATSNVQAEALAESVEIAVKNQTGFHPRQVEGKQLGEWILMDYFDVVVHIFLEPVRSFYKLEELWADADVLQID